MKNPQILEVVSAKGATMQDVASKIGMSCDELTKYATSPFDVPDEVIEKIAGVLGVDAADFSDDRYENL